MVKNLLMCCSFIVRLLYIKGIILHNLLISKRVSINYNNDMDLLRQKGGAKAMNVDDVHNRIKDMARERGLTSYELAKRSGLVLSSLYNMFERGTMPKLETLEKICNGLDVSLSDFFSFLSKPQTGGYLTENDIALLEANRRLPERKQENLVAYAKGMCEACGDRNE